MKETFNIGFKKIVGFIGILPLLLMVNVAYTYKPESCGADCRACHKLNEKETSEIFKEFGAYIFSGDIIDVPTKKKVGELVSYKQESKKKDFSKTPLKDDLVIGNRAAKNKVIVFTDPDCPFCRELHKEIKKVTFLRKDIAFYIKLFPLVMLHPEAYNKSKAIVCEKSLKLLDDAFTGGKIPFPKCETTQIDDNIRLAISLGINSTPTIILKDGSIILGYRDADTLIKLIDGVK